MGIIYRLLRSIPHDAKGSSTARPLHSSSLDLLDFPITDLAFDILSIINRIFMLPNPKRR